MPIINIQILEGRPEEKVSNLIKNVTETVSETLDAPKENIRVIVTEVPKSRWAAGGITMAERGR
ncbi:MAG TPA: 4-oxalocrotonate tautomerase [Chondromyces sp.]|nr:4-oxalocrotonate tautomerase [Chondromyces sp.]